MFDVEHDGNVYRYCRGDKGSYWIGISGARSGFYPGAHCRVPLGYWNTLRKAALEQGADEAIFKTPKKVEKKSVSRSKKKDENSISIF